MSKQWVTIGATEAVVNEVKANGVIEVVYKDGAKNIYEDAHLVNGK